MDPRAELLREFGGEARARALPLTYGAGPRSGSFYGQPSDSGRQMDSSYSATAQLGRTDVDVVARVLELLESQAARAERARIHLVGGLIQGTVGGTVLHLNAVTPPRLIPLISTLVGGRCASIGVTADERVDVTTVICSVGGEADAFLGRLTRAGDAVGEVLAAGMSPDGPAVRREFNVDIPGAVGHLALQLFLTATPTRPISSRVIADIAELIRAVERDIAPLQVQAVTNGPAGDLSITSRRKAVDESTMIEAVRVAAGHARELPEWRGLTRAGLEWSPEVKVISPAHLAGRAPLWETGHREPGTPFERKLRAAVTVTVPPGAPQG